MSSPSNHFFKFIPPGFKYNVSIPRSLSTKLNRGGCKKVILRRGRREWLVDISDGGVFGDGWRKFVTDNGVQEFDFIVFKHQGNMVFDFTVFDQSACERQYQSLYDEMDVEESLTDHTHKRLKKLKKCERNDYSTKKEDKFQLDDDRCFMTIMTAYYIKSSRVHVPMKFARSNGLFTDRGHRQIVIMDEALRTCQATVEIRTDQFRLRGWRELIIKNQFKAGDTCMFELVKHGEVPVIIIYNLGKKPVHNNIKVKKETSTPIEKATTSTVKNQRHFTSTLKPCTFKKSCLYLPAEFSIANGLKAGEMILIDNKGRSWNVQLKKNGENHFYLGCGLKALCDANGLKEGDAYKFELVENEIGKPPVVNFSLNIDSTPSRKEDHPYFIGEVKSYNIENSMLYLPNRFVKKSGLFNKEEMILKNVKDERSWTVELKSSVNNYRYIGRGWKDFYVANGLKEGDLFKLELVSNGVKPVANFYFQKIY